MELARRPETDLGRLVHTVERDPDLAVDVLRLAHGPGYVAIGVASVEQVLTRLGVEPLIELVLRASFRPLFVNDVYAERVDALRRHSVATAHITRIVCRQTALDGDYAFVCGLLHDAGVLAALSVFAQASAPPSLVEIWAAVEAVHAEAGATVARHWRLPMDVAYVLQFHHLDEARAGLHPMAAAVCVADRLAVQLGFAYGDDDMRALPRASHVLGLTPAVIKLIRRQAEAVLDGVD